MRVLFAAVVVIGLAGCSSPYDDLRSSFKREGPSTGHVIPVRTVVVESTKKRGPVKYNDALTVSLSSETLDIDRVFWLSKESLRIRGSDVSGCSKTCFSDGSWYSDLFLDETGTEISFSNANEVLDWCWSNHIPMISAQTSREWLYNKGKLPGRGTFAEQLASRERYNDQMNKSCQGF